jgi:hypothetical protein
MTTKRNPKDSGADILCSYPVEDDATWTKRHLWMEWSGARTRYTTCDTEGDHESCSAREAREIMDSSCADWVRYSEWVVANGGADPLEEFLVKSERTSVQTWTLAWSRSILGPIALRLRCGRGEWIAPKDAPAAVREFLNLPTDRNARSVLQDFTSPAGREEWDRILSGETGADQSNVRRVRARAPGHPVKLQFSITVRTPRSDRAVRRDVLKIARRHIRSQSKVRP